jgi:predicted nucleotidyltransferase
MQPSCSQQQELTSLCRRYHVRRLELFGSAAAGAFDSATSDLDFLVEFEELDLPAFADAYFGLQESLASLYKRPVDLVIHAAVHTPVSCSIERNRVLLYAARPSIFDIKCREPIVVFHTKRSQELTADPLLHRHRWPVQN